VEEASWNSYKNGQRHQRCLQDTRKEILQDIVSWANGHGATSQPIFWLAGMAGTGKSTIAMTLSEILSHTKVVASFFFERGAGELASSRRLIPTVAYQMAIKSTALRTSILKSVKLEPHVAKLAINYQLQQLFVRPLQDIMEDPNERRDLVIIIDALDECEDLADVKALIEILGSLDLPSIEARILLTSRPEWPIRLAFRNLSTIYHQELALHEVPRASVDTDIEVFTRDRMKDIRRSHNLPYDWPSENDIKTLVSRAAGLFIFAATVCRYVDAPRGSSPIRRLKQVCQAASPGSGSHYIREIDSIYSTVVSTCFAGDFDADELLSYKKVLQRMLTTIVIAFDELPTEALAEFAEADLAILIEALEALHAVMYTTRDRPKIVRVIHESFRDYMLDRARCVDVELAVDHQGGHCYMGEVCIRVLRTQLRENICWLLSPGLTVSEMTISEVEEQVSPALRYACIFWTRHVRAAAVQLEDDGPVHHLIKHYSLMWIEAMSLLGNASEVITALADLESLINIDHAPSISSLIYDLKRFMRKFGRTIQRAPLQTYYCASYYSRPSSLVRSIPEYQSNLHLTLKHSELEWDCIPLIIDTASEIMLVLLSADGTTLVTLSSDGSVAIWDPLSGHCEAHLQESVDPTTCLEFAPCGSFLATGSTNGTIRIWDTTSWHLIRSFVGHEVSISHLMFLLTSLTLVSVAVDGSLRTWSVLDGSCHKCISTPNASEAPILALDGQCVMMACSETPPQMWCLETGRLLCVIGQHPVTTRLLALSTAKHRTASVSDDNIIRLWDHQTGDCVQVLSGHADEIEYIMFSPDASSIASVSRNRVRIWDCASGACSVDNDFILSSALGDYARHSKTFLGWTSQTQALWRFLSQCVTHAVEEFSDHRGLQSVSFSSALSVAVTGSLRGTLRVWHMETEFLPVPFNTSADEALATWRDESTSNAADNAAKAREQSAALVLADGSHIVTASRYGTLKIWNPQTVQIDQKHRFSGRSIAIADDGSFIATLSSFEIVSGNSLAAVLSYLDHPYDPIGHAAWRDGRVDGLLEHRILQTECQRASLMAYSTRPAPMLALLLGDTLAVWTSKDEDMTSFRKLLPWTSVSSLLFSNDGRYVTAYSWHGGSAKLDVETKVFVGSTSETSEKMIIVRDEWICVGDKTNPVVLLPEIFTNCLSIEVAQAGNTAFVTSELDTALIIRLTDLGYDTR
jgi:WD40 repeat protein